MEDAAGCVGLDPQPAARGASIRLRLANAQPHAQSPIIPCGWPAARNTLSARPVVDAGPLSIIADLGHFLEPPCRHGDCLRCSCRRRGWLVDGVAQQNEQHLFDVHSTANTGLGGSVCQVETRDVDPPGPRLRAPIHRCAGAAAPRRFRSMGTGSIRPRPTNAAQHARMASPARRDCWLIRSRLAASLS